MQKEIGESHSLQALETRKTSQLSESDKKGRKVIIVTSPTPLPGPLVPHSSSCIIATGEAGEVVLGCVVRPCLKTDSNGGWAR